MRVLHVVGDRPNFMKVAPVMAEMAEHPDEFDQILVHTGQHYDDNMSQILLAIDSPMLDWSYGLERSSYAPGYGRCKSVGCLWIAVQFEERCSVSWNVRSRHPSTDITSDPVRQRLNERRNA